MQKRNPYPLLPQLSRSDSARIRDSKAANNVGWSWFKRWRFPDTINRPQFAQTSLVIVKTLSTWDWNLPIAIRVVWLERVGGKQLASVFLLSESLIRSCFAAQMVDYLDRNVRVLGLAPEQGSCTGRDAGWTEAGRVHFGSNLRRDDDTAGVFAGLPLLGDYEGESCCIHFKEDWEEVIVS